MEKREKMTEDKPYPMPALYHLPSAEYREPAILPLKGGGSNCPIYPLDEDLGIEERLAMAMGGEHQGKRNEISCNIYAVNNKQLLPQEIVRASDSKAAQMSAQNSNTISSENEKEGRKKPKTNFDVKPMLVKKCLDRNGKVVFEKSEIIASISIYTNLSVRQFTFTIPWLDLENLTRIVLRKFPTAIIFDRRQVECVENNFREAMSGIREMNCYIDHGWQMIHGRHVYIHKGASGIQGEIMTGRNLPIDNRFNVSDCFDIYKHSISIYKDVGIMSVMSSFSFLGISYKLFEEAGFAPSFLLFLTGKTGSFKTAMAKLLYVQVEIEKYRRFPRRLDSDTETSLERGLVVGGRDTTLLIDDFSPAQNSRKKLNLENKLELVVRMVGDRSSKSRSNPSLEDCRGEGVQGVVVLTGELRNRGLSSNLRCLYCAIDRKNVNVEAVSWMQDNEAAYTTLIQYFIYFLSSSWETVVSYIRDNYNKLRKSAEKLLKASRLVDSLVTLWLMSDILESFFQYYCGVGEEAKIISEFKAQMVPVFVASESASFEEEPGITFIRALIAMMENQKLLVKDGRLTEAELGQYDGFFEGDYLYLLPDLTYQKTVNWIRTGGVFFSLSAKEIASTLCKEGYAVSSPNGNGKTTIYARLLVGGSQKINFLKLRLALLRELAQNDTTI